MTDLRTAAQQALDFIVATNKSSQFWLVPESNLNKTVTALKAALAEDALQRLTDVQQEIEAALAEPEPCRYPDCVDNGPDGKCTRWLLAECSKSEDYKPQRPAEPVQEPVAWRYQDARGNYRYRGYVAGFDVEYAILKPVPLYAAPPQRPAEPVQEEEIDELWYEIDGEAGPMFKRQLRAFARAVEAAFARAVEAAHGIKEGT